MNFIRAAVFLSLLRLVNCFSNETDDNLSLSFESLIKEICLNDANCNTGIDFFILTKDFVINDQIGKIILQTNLTIRVQDKFVKLHQRENQRFIVLIFIDDVESFQKFYEEINVRNFYPNGFFIVVFKAATADEMDLIFKLLWKKFVYNVNIITQTTTGLIEMFSFMPFGKSKCGDASNVKINEFEEESMKWSTESYFPKKFKNLRKCVIKCGLFKLEPANIIDTFPNGSQHIHGFDVDIFTALMNTINAKVNFTVYPISTGKIFPNGSATGLLGTMIRGEVDASLRSWSLQLDRRQVLSETISYFSDKLVLIMPLPVPLSPLLKLIRPLKSEVWFALIGLFLIAAAVILLLKIVPKKHYKRIIGKRLQNEFLNLLIGAVGLSQTSLPEKNFPRYLLTMFLLFCLVVRSLYLGSLFNMLKTELRTKEFTSISDFYNAGFDFYMYDSLSQRLDYPLINSRRKIIDLSLVDDYCRKTIDPEFKGVVFQYVTTALYNNKQNYRTFTYKICRESLMTNHLVFYFTKGFYLVDEINDKINQMKTSGIIQFYTSKYADEKFRTQPNQNTGPSKLNLNHFSGIFQVWGFGLLIGFLIFLLELLLHKLKRRNHFSLNNP